MVRANTQQEDAFFFSVPQARWVLAVLNMAVAVVGADSLLGLILRQTRSEIASLVRDEDPEPAPARRPLPCPENN
jgi:hypothetical protein